MKEACSESQRADFLDASYFCGRDVGYPFRKLISLSLCSSADTQAFFLGNL